MDLRYGCGYAGCDRSEIIFGFFDCCIFGLARLQTNVKNSHAIVGTPGNLDSLPAAGSLQTVASVSSGQKKPENEIVSGLSEVPSGFEPL